MNPNIRFIKSHNSPSGMVSGRLEVLEDAPTAGAERFLGELNDVHPDFAAHVVKAVNTYAALHKAMSAQGSDGPLAKALRQALASERP